MKGMMIKSLIVGITLLVSPLVEAKIGEGTIDLQNGFISFIEESIEGRVLIGADLPNIDIDNDGKLYLVYPSGRSQILSGGYRDQRGATVQAVRGSQDKVIYLSLSGEIVGGFGLSSSDVFSIIHSNPHLFANAYQSYTMLREEKDLLEKLMAVQIAAEAFESRLNGKEQMEIFLTTIKMVAGKEFADAIMAISSHGEPIVWGNHRSVDRPIVLQGYSHAVNLPDLPEKNLNLGGMTLMHIN